MTLNDLERILGRPRYLEHVVIGREVNGTQVFDLGNPVLGREWSAIWSCQVPDVEPLTTTNIDGCCIALEEGDDRWVLTQTCVVHADRFSD